MEQWITTNELMGLKITGLPESRPAVLAYARRHNWSFRRVEKGPGYEFSVSSLPKKIQNMLMKRVLAQSTGDKRLPVVASANLPATTAKRRLPAVSAEDLTNKQQSIRDARAIILAEIDRLVMTGIGRSRAIDIMVNAARNGELSPELARAAERANARKTADRTLSRRSIYLWSSALDEAEGNHTALAPSHPSKDGIPAWAPTLMSLWCKPQKPTLAECINQWPADLMDQRPTYHQARYFMKRLDPLTKAYRRSGPKALQQMRAYVQRSVDDLWPGAVFVGDGHTFKREVAHPIHGKAFRPEITVFLDVFTKVWPGFSVDLAENTWAVADALRDCVTEKDGERKTTPDILYYDNGAGAKNITWDDPALGLVARLGCQKLHSAPWSSQARGVVEVFNRHVLHKLAKRAESYVGGDMDEEARRRAFKVSRQQLKAFGASQLITAWSDFVMEVEEARQDYNNTPHSSLPKIVDPVTGKRRNMTPNERWDEAVANGCDVTP